MIVHSDSFFGVMVLLLVALGTVLGVLASVIFLLALKYRVALRVFVATVAVFVTFLAIQSTMRVLTPQLVVKRGDSFCDDIWCIGVTDVKAAVQDTSVVYRIDVHIFSDANRGNKIHAKTRLFLVDEQDRRFPLIPDPTAIPFTRELAPQEGIDTTLTFKAAADSKELYLTGEPTEGLKFVVRLFNGDLLAEHFTFLRKPTLLRVL